MRCFLAIELPNGTRDRLAALQRDLHVLGRDVRWTRPDQIHLTLKFLGDVADATAADACRAAAEIAGRHDPFELTVSGVGCFPPGGNVRVIWAGVDGPPPPLVACHKDAENRFADLGYTPENRAFRPHLTIGRVRDGRRSRSIRAALQAHRAFAAGTWEVTELVLFQSTLSPSGPIYTALTRAPLGAETGRSTA